MSRKSWTVFWLVALLLLFVFNGSLLITDSVESNYALTAKEMVVSGDWLSPQIYGQYWFVGHAEIDMITSIYAHILDEDRKVNAQKFETAFYAKPDLRNVRPPEEPAKSEPATLDLESLVEQLQKSPELASALAALIAAQAPAK